MSVLNQMTPISYHSQQDRDYAAALRTADTLPKLRAVTEAWQEIAADAHAIAAAMTEADFEEWLKGDKKERRGQFAGETHAQKYGALILPAVLFTVSYMAAEYKVPWGLMYLRLKDTGGLEKILGRPNGQDRNQG